MVDSGQSLGVVARQRMQAGLPELLAVVRARGRRRRRRRAGFVLAAVLSVVLGGFGWWCAAGRAAPAVVPPPPSAMASAVEIVPDDPTVLARCSVPTVVRSEWFVDDDGLQALLRSAERDAGLVRTRDRVLLAATAVDSLAAMRP